MIIFVLYYTSYCVFSQGTFLSIHPGKTIY